MAGCDHCRRDLDAVLRVAAGADWQDPERPAERPTPDLIERAREAAARDVIQRVRAEHTFAAVVAMAPRQRFAELVKREGSMTPSLAWKIMEEADKRLLSEPRQVLPLYELATYVADASVAQSLASHEIRLEAWKNYAWLLSYLGEFATAEYALDWAEDAADQCADRAHALAIVDLSRAIFLAQMERWAEALVLATRAHASFLKLGDEERAVKAEEQEANIRMSMGDAPGAITILSRIISVPADDAAIARRLGNIAHALELAGALWPASEHLARARSIHARIGATMMLHKNTWALARILAKAGRLDEALEAFADASAGFRTLDSVDHAIRVDLDQSEVELDHGATTDATYQRLRAAAAYAVEKQLAVAKCRALEYLQRLGRSATPRDIRFVQDFFSRYESDPLAQFRPPEEPHDG